jgi:membrane-bound ClpP family serine protease
MIKALILIGLGVIILAIDLHVIRHGGGLGLGLVLLGAGLFMMMLGLVSVWMALVVLLLLLGISGVVSYSVFKSLKHALQKRFFSFDVVGRVGKAITPLAPVGQVLVDGTRWQAECSTGTVKPGDLVYVVERHGLKLIVAPVTDVQARFLDAPTGIK